MKRVLAFTALVWITSLVTLQALPIDPDTTSLKPKPVYGQEARVISYILNNNHYSKIRLNDSLSSAILDGYIKEMDNNKSYFLASDVQSFEKYRTQLDNYTRDESVEPAYEIYNVFRKRYAERLNYVMDHLVGMEFDFTTDEYYETDREKGPWANSQDELNDVWRKMIKSQALSLKLAGKTSEQINETISGRYERMIRSAGQFKTEDVFNMYMNAITQSYDPHTNYMTPRASENFDQSMRLSLEGIGARLQTDNDYTKVMEIITGGPAEKSDLIHANDYIIGVAQGADEMVDVIGWRIDDVVSLIKGPKGSTVRLQLLPSTTGVSGPPVVISLIRDKINLEDQAAKKQVIKYEVENKELTLGVITLPGFYMDFEAYQKGDPDYKSTTRDVKRLLEELKAEKVDGLVMDLRDNGGGSLAEAIDLTGLFIKEGPVVQVKSSGNKVDVGYDDDGGQTVYDGPMIILINRFSASASEIFSGAIQDYQRGVIVGESTYGKGTVQTVLDLKRYIRQDPADVGELKLTFQKFYRVTGSSTQHKGVSPDIALPTALAPTQYGESSNDSALPWDEIKGTSYQKSASVNEKVLAALVKSYGQREKDDVALKNFIDQQNESRKNLSQTQVSLNEAKRKAEMEEAERKKANTGMNAKVVGKEGTPVNVLELEDEYLREGLLILTDLALKRIG